MKTIIGFLIMAASAMCGLYVGGWLMFVHPIIEACKAFDAGILTGVMVGTVILKCLFAGFVRTIIFYIGIIIGSLFVD